MDVVSSMESLVPENFTESLPVDNASSHPTFSLIPPKPYLIFQAGFLSITLVATVFGSVAVCYVVYRTRSGTTVTGMCMTSLAIADLLRGCLVIPFVIVSSIELGHHGHWSLGPVICSLVGFVNTLFGSASVMMLAAVSVDRYVAIMKPLKYSTIVTTLRAAIMLTIVWSLSAIMSILPVIGWSEYNFIPWTCLCLPDWAESKSYAYTYLVLTFLIPLCILLYCYFMIFRIARKQSRKVESMGMASMEISRQTNAPSTTGKPKPRLVTRKEKKAAVVLFAVLGVFIVCMTPYCVVYLLSSYSSVSDSIFAALGITSLLSFINSAVNPLIYGILNRKFRRLFVEVITCNQCPCRRRNLIENIPQGSRFQRNDFISDHLGKSITLTITRPEKLVQRDSCYATGPNTGCKSQTVFAISPTASVTFGGFGDIMQNNS